MRLAALPAESRTTERLFAKRVRNPETGCWDWIGGIGSHGYGALWDGRQMTVAHRVMYELVVGPIPDGLDIDHLCRNRACVNPAHMEPVTRGENLRRGGGFAGRGYEHHGQHAPDCSGCKGWHHARGERCRFYRCRVCGNLEDYLALPADERLTLVAS